MLRDNHFGLRTAHNSKSKVYTIVETCRVHVQCDVDPLVPPPLAIKISNGSRFRGFSIHPESLVQNQREMNRDFNLARFAPKTRTHH